MSYTHHSRLPTAPGPYVLGVDEAGRGPVLGPLVYGVAYCPVAYAPQLDRLGFAGPSPLPLCAGPDAPQTPRLSRPTPAPASSPPSTPTPSTSAGPCASSGAHSPPCRVPAHRPSPHAISSAMLRRPPTNLNVQSQDATVRLIRDILDRGIHLAEVYVDALGTTTTYHAYLSALFPAIDFTVTSKADSKFKIVGAASVAAKVTRDSCLENWVFEEPLAAAPPACSGYPSDPKTQAWLKHSIEPTFGYPKLVRFSWTTVKLLLDKNAHPVKWTDEGQASLISAFESGKGPEKDRCAVTKNLNLISVPSL
ncbi:hypothetical protein H2248_008393 [Termitomyces sp. 'cryptogamus']|nr:hypothetical protein H2248_008393 [Termitomyces sp. 'cryptogamus']